MKLGYQNLEKCVMLAVEIGNVGDRMGRTTGAARYGHLLMLIDELQALATTDFTQIKAEFKDLDGAERVELYEKIKVKFEIEDDKVEALVEEALGIIVDAASLVKRSVDLVKNLKSA